MCIVDQCVGLSCRDSGETSTGQPQYQPNNYGLVSYAPEHPNLIDYMVPVPRRLEFFGQHGV